MGGSEALVTDRLYWRMREGGGGGIPVCFGQRGSCLTECTETEDFFAGLGRVETRCLVWFGRVVYSLIHFSLFFVHLETTMAKDKAVSFAKLAVFFVIYSPTEPWNTTME